MATEKAKAKKKYAIKTYNYGFDIDGYREAFRASLSRSLIDRLTGRNKCPDLDDFRTETVVTVQVLDTYQAAQELFCRLYQPWTKGYQPTGWIEETDATDAEVDNAFNSWE